MELRERIEDALLSTPYARRVGEEYIYVRCPLCGDSKKHLDKAHCSIWITDDKPLIYHCWICEESGIVTHSFLRDIGIISLEMFNAVGRYNKAAGSLENDAKFVIAGKGYNLTIPKIRKRDERKVEYVSNRLNIPFTTKALEYLRVITSIRDFLEINELKPHSKFKHMIIRLDRDYVGFLTSDRSTIVFRAVGKDIEPRYFKYPIFEGLLLTENCYTVPMSVNPMVNSIDLNITEGIFDILGVFFNVNKGKTENSIYAAVCGSGYMRIIKYFLSKGFIANLNLNIYSDSDKTFSGYTKVFRKSMWMKNINIFYNEFPGEKDFGVPADRIKVGKAVIR